MEIRPGSVDGYDCFRTQGNANLLIAAVICQDSPIDYAKRLLDEMKPIIYFVQDFIEFKENVLCQSSEEIEKHGFKKYSDDDLAFAMNYFFDFDFDIRVSADEDIGLEKPKGSDDIVISDEDNSKSARRCFDVSYVKKLLVSSNVLNSYSLLDFALSLIKKLLSYPSDAQIRKHVEDKELTNNNLDFVAATGRFKFMSIKDRAKYVKQYERQKNLVSKAREIITLYSEEYKSIRYLFAK